MGDPSSTNGMGTFATLRLFLPATIATLYPFREPQCAEAHAVVDGLNWFVFFRRAAVTAGLVGARRNQRAFAGLRGRQRLSQRM